MQSTGAETLTLQPVQPSARMLSRDVRMHTDRAHGPVCGRDIFSERCRKPGMVILQGSARPIIVTRSVA